MSRVKTPKYRVEMNCISFLKRCRETHSFAWQGKPSEKRLQGFLKDMNASMNAGGTNEHLRNGQSDYTSARIVRQSDDAKMVSYSQPMFEVVD